MSKAVLASAIALATSLPMTVSKTAVDAVTETMVQTLKDTGVFTLPGFGSFTVASRKARKARNPRTGEVLKIGADRTVRFKASPVLKDSVKRAKLKGAVPKTPKASKVAAKPRAKRNTDTDERIAA